MNWQHTNRLWLPRTGQTTSYRAGDDGGFQAGVPAPSPAARFLDNGNGTIRDHWTGLMWVKEPQLIIPGATGVHATNQVQVAHGNWATGHAYVPAELVTAGGLFYVCAIAHTSGTFATDLAAGKWRQTIWTSSAASLQLPATMSWNNAIDNCLALEYAGFTDWRLPNILELASIRNWGATVAPAAYTAAFPNTASARYWPSSTVEHSSTNAYTVSFTTTGNAIVYDAKTVLSYVRPVRGGRINA